MNALITFSFHSSTVRTVVSNNETYFCLIDVCSVLGLTNASKVSNQVKDEFGCPNLKLGHLKDALGRDQTVTFITEPQLYFVMMRSRAKTAREFRQWICNEVLPQIRRTGSYSVPNTKGNNKYEWMKRDLQNIINVNDLTMNRILEVCDRAWRQGYAVASSVKEREALKTEPQALKDGTTISRKSVETVYKMLKAHAEHSREFCTVAIKMDEMIKDIEYISRVLWYYSDFLAISAPSALRELEQVKA